MIYNYKIYFKKEGKLGYRYNMHFIIEAENNEQAKIKGEQRWNEQVNKRIDLQNVDIVKIVCRKQETKPRAKKQTALDKALSAVNQYISEELKQ